MVRVGEDQEILTLEPCVMSVHGTADKNSWNGPERFKHHYGAEPSFHRSASQRNAALVLIRAYVTP